MLWHFWLGHPNFTYMKYLFPNLFSKVDVSSLSCDVCIQAKEHQVSFPSQTYKPTQPFTLIHSEVWDPSKFTTFSGKRWFVTFIDDHTYLTWVFLITDKFEVSYVFQNFYQTIKMQFNAKIAILWSHNGQQFQNHTLNDFLASKGIVHQSSYAYTPKQNGVAEQKNRHLLEAISLCCPSTRLTSEVPLLMFGCTMYVHSFGPRLLIKPNLPLGLKRLCLLSILFIGEAIIVSILLFVNTLSLWMSPFVRIDPSFPLAIFKEGESVSEESNYTLESINPTPITLHDSDPHPMVLPTNQVP